MPRLRKRLGQHHLLHEELCRPAVEFLSPAGRRVVEIGPGGGALTRPLLAAGARLWAWEIDPSWAWELGRRIAAPAAVVIGDALAIPWARLPAGTLAAGNLPYAIASELILRCLRHAAIVPRAAFLVQLEVAERLVARPGEPAYGALTVAVAARAEAILLSRVRRGSFRPPPRVDGAFVGLAAARPVLPADALDGLLATVRLAFGQRRKTLRNALAAGWGVAEAERVLAAAGLDPRARAQELPLAAFQELHAHKGGDGSHPQRR
jgi:16S rRNA (adenine1518-N6/adenine1519-N6)-dimethyltransferase